METKFAPRGKFRIQHIRNNEVLADFEVPNGITDEGLNHILNTEFHNTSAVATWYLGLVNNTPAPTFAAADTAAQIGGTNNWTEAAAQYNEATRVQWTEGAAAARSITNSVTCDFTANTGVTIKGIFVVSASAKNATTGTLWATAAFGSPVTLAASDILKVTYTVSG